ncbi:MAG: single-stranded DNA-binding protein [Actinomycetales bacterium]|nr:single-stranded DNA-binding protein [Candidatus Phosphoribacter baldrii]
MAGDTVITIVGNVTGDPELRFTPSGAAVANFTVASTPRAFDRQSNEWKDGETLFMRCSVWRDAAENVAESLQRGTRVIVTGRLKSRSYETKEGEKRTVIEMDVDEVGPSLRYASAKVTKTQRGSGGGGFGSSGSGQGGYAADTDPWATGPSGGGHGGLPAVAAAVAATAVPVAVARVAPAPVVRRAVRVAGARPLATTSLRSDRVFAASSGLVSGT